VGDRGEIAHTTNAGVGSNGVGSSPNLESNVWNSPNPFVASTAVHFALPNASYVSVRVNDAFGVEVARLYEGELGTGEHSLIWNANGAAAGMYFVRVQTADGSVLRKVIRE
jgi:hypothetical protein